MGTLSVGDWVAVWGGYEGYPMWDRTRDPPEVRSTRRWTGTIVASLEPSSSYPMVHAERILVVHMDRILLDEYDTLLLWLPRVSSWNELPVIVHACVTKLDRGPQGWAEDLRTNYVEASLHCDRAD